MLQFLKKHLLYLTVLAGLILVACEDDLAVEPAAYLHIKGFNLTTNNGTEGSPSHNISTVWLYVDGKIQGVYEVPVTVPIVTTTGTHKIRLSPGIKVNGISATRSPYPFYTDYEEDIFLTQNEVHYVNAANDSMATTTYNTKADFDFIEDFESGLSIERTSKSDSLSPSVIVTDPNLIFPEAGNTSSYEITLRETDSSSTIVELQTIDAYDDLPKFGANVFLELNYKSEHRFVVGVFGIRSGGQVNQVPTVTVNPSDEWNKIYINLVNEISSDVAATEFRIFIGAVKGTTEVGEKKIYLDNIKLIH